MPKVLLDEILGNLIGKNAIFHVKEVFFFYQKQQSLQSQHGFLTKKTPENPQKWSKRW